MNECPKGNSKCESLRYFTFYDDYGDKEILIPTCFSNCHQEFAKWINFGFGEYKLCRRNLYNKIGSIEI